MMKNLFKYYILIFVLFSDFVMFAQPGDEDDGTGGDGGGLEDDDSIPAAPINSKLIFLAIVGVFFVIYTYRKSRKTA